MKKVIVGIVSFGMILFASCEQGAETDVNEESNEETIDQMEGDIEHSSDEEKADESSAISLNEGEKWEINEEMTPFVEAGNQAIEDYLALEDEDYRSLAERVARENEQLINSCTMEGKSHEELHKWLHPHLDLTKELRNAATVDEANDVIQQLADSYDSFYEYFE